MKPLIIGEAPFARPIEGVIGQRLATLSGLMLPEFLIHFDRVNLLHVRQDTAVFDQPEAVRSADRLAKTFLPGQIVLLLGRRTAGAFRLPDVDYFVQLRINETEIRVVPHPSSINRWWNDPIHVAQAERFMQTIVQRTL